MPPNTVESTVHESVDLSAYEQVIASAIQAFAYDFSYAETILTKARMMRTHRTFWATLTELRHAEALAREACAKDGITGCVLTTPCGVGECPYASGDHRKVTEVAFREYKHPKPDGTDACHVHSAVQPLLEHRNNLAPGSEKAETTGGT